MLWCYDTCSSMNVFHWICQIPSLNSVLRMMSQWIAGVVMVMLSASSVIAQSTVQCNSCASFNPLSNWCLDPFTGPPPPDKYPWRAYCNSTALEPSAPGCGKITMTSTAKYLVILNVEMTVLSWGQWSSNYQLSICYKWCSNYMKKHTAIVRWYELSW